MPRHFHVLKSTQFYIPKFVVLTGSFVNLPYHFRYMIDEHSNKPLILALHIIFQKQQGETHFCYQTLISRIRCNF